MAGSKFRWNAPRPRCKPSDWKLNRFARWDDKQTGDLIHYAGRMPSAQIELAHQNGIKVVMAELLTAPGSRSPAQLRLQRILNRTLERVAPGTFCPAFNWSSYRLADASIALTSWEAHLMTYLFGAPPERVHVVPNGVRRFSCKLRRQNAVPGWSAPPRLRNANGCWNWRKRRCWPEPQSGVWAGPTRIRSLCPTVFCPGPPASEAGSF